MKMNATRCIPPPRKTRTLRPVCDSLNQSTVIMSASTYLTPFTLWSVKHRNAINKWLQGVLMILVLFFLHYREAPQCMSGRATIRCSKWCKQVLEAVSESDRSLEAQQNSVTQWLLTMFWHWHLWADRGTAQPQFGNNIWQHFYTGSKSQSICLKNTMHVVKAEVLALCFVCFLFFFN